MMGRRLFLGGAIAGLGAATARAAYLTNSPVVTAPFWLPRRKPGPPHRIQLDSAALLSRGLISCILFDECAQAGTIRDLSAPGGFTFTGTAHTQTASVFGGDALNTSGSSTTDFLSYNISPLTSAVWSASYMAKFDGTTAGTGAVSPFGGTAITGGPFSSDFSNAFQTGSTNGPDGIAISSGNNQYTTFASTVFFTPAITTFTTWSRHTFTSDGTTIRFYADGRLQSSVTITLDLIFQNLVNGWQWPMSDFFLWNRTLSASDVAEHAATPFSVVRPRFVQQLVASAVTGTCPPQRPESADFSQDFGPFTSSCGAVKGSLMTMGIGP